MYIFILEKVTFDMRGQKLLKYISHTLLYILQRNAINFYSHGSTSKKNKTSGIYKKSIEAESKRLLPGALFTKNKCLVLVSPSFTTLAWEGPAVG